jgi:hypothetical protein
MNSPTALDAGPRACRSEQTTSNVVGGLVLDCGDCVGEGDAAAAVMIPSVSVLVLCGPVGALLWRRIGCAVIRTSGRRRRGSVPVCR